MNGDRLEQRVNQARAKLDKATGAGSGDGRPVGFDHDDNVVRFATDGLGLRLYPRQATVLKVLTCNEALLTPFDHEVLNDWASGYRPVTTPEGPYFDGTRGTTPDVLERMRHCRQLGRTSFSEVSLVLGRRSSKSFIAAILSAFHVSEVLGMGDPHAVLGLPGTKRLVFAAVSTTRAATTRDVFGDLAGMIGDGPAFDGFVEHCGPAEVRLWTPAQIAAGARERHEPGLVVISALPTVAAAGRGPAVYGLVLDEFAHLSGSGPTSTDTEMLRTLSPAMAQFANASTMLCSSPWTQIGALYAVNRGACKIDPATGHGVDQTTFTLQLPSWELYLDWSDAPTLPMWPDGPTFPAHTSPKISMDSPQLERERSRDYANYLVEYEAQWATVTDRYLPATSVDRVFEPFDSSVQDQSWPAGMSPSALHLDLSHVGDNSALALGHLIHINGQQHIDFDDLRFYQPSDDPDGQVDYDEIADVAVPLAMQHGARITMDNFQSIAMTEKILVRLHQWGLSGLGALRLTPEVLHVTADTKAERWELFKTLAAEGRIHAPWNQQAYNELSFLRRVDRKIEAPTSGPVTTDDLADAMSFVVYRLINNDGPIHARFSGAPVVPGMPSGDNPYAPQFRDAMTGHRRRPPHNSARTRRPR